MSTVKTKICRICDTEKTVDHFYKTPRNKTGYFHECKECHKSYVRKNQQKQDPYRFF